MQRITNECCDCASGSYSCGACSLREVKRFYCDKCGSETELFDLDGDELCQDCLLERIPKVEGSWF
jgi:hypothetical protein